MKKGKKREGKKLIQIDSKLLSEFPFRGDRDPDNNLESFCISISILIVRSDGLDNI
jgi:hypothetical protein